MAYHDLEWGVPLYGDRRLFEFLTLESSQAGLSWYTVVRKRENHSLAFDGFDPEKVAREGCRKTRSRKVICPAGKNLYIKNSNFVVKGLQGISYMARQKKGQKG